MVSIKNLPKASVLRALFNATHQQGMGFLNTRGASDMTPTAAQQLLDNGQTYFDYLFGRVMKVDLSNDAFEERLFDRDNYLGAAQDAITKLRNELNIPE